MEQISHCWKELKQVRILRVRLRGILYITIKGEVPWQICPPQQDREVYVCHGTEQYCDYTAVLCADTSIFPRSGTVSQSESV